MKWIKKTFIMAALFIAVSGALNVQAAYSKNLKTYKKIQTVKVDLNKDGKKEIIRAEYDTEEVERTLYINDELMLKNAYSLWIVDVDPTDQYIEIVAEYYSTHKLRFYRYNGKKLVLYTTASTDYEMAKLKKKNHVYYGFSIEDIKPAGKGKIMTYVNMSTRSVVNEFGSPCYLKLGLTYTVKKNDIRFDQTATYKATILYEKSGEATRKWEAYQYPRLKSNKKVFTVKKGESIQFTNIKITPPYAYMKIRKVKTKQTGWVVFRTKDLDI